MNVDSEFYAVVTFLFIFRQSLVELREDSAPKWLQSQIEG